METCFREPIPALFDAAHFLDAAVSVHLVGDEGIARERFQAANISLVREWLESIWGPKSQYVTVQPLPAPADASKVELRMPTKAQIHALHARDGFHCRCFGIPVIRPEVRQAALRLNPDAISWGRTNASQHAGFQTRWAQYDHVVPHPCGGTNQLDTEIVRLSCLVGMAWSGCSFGV